MRGWRFLLPFGRQLYYITVSASKAVNFQEVLDDTAINTLNMDLLLISVKHRAQ